MKKKNRPERRIENRRKSPWFDPYYGMDYYERRRQRGNRRKDWPGQSGH